VRPEAWNGERGYTMIELLVVMVASVIVIGLPMMFVVVSLTQQNVSVSRAVAATQEDVGLGRLTRDLRQVVPSTTAASTFTWSSTVATASFTMPTPGTGNGSTQTVVWSCTFGDTGTCTRAVSGGTAVKEISNVEGVSFSPLDANGNPLGGAGPSYSATNPAYVGITLQVLDVSQLDNTPSPSHVVRGISNWITVRDGVALRGNSG
jgi:prepilin-type N-terminal cleavage/methylation domain-containing protein